MNDSLFKIRELIIRSSKIAIAGHTSPDGDAIGACTALAGALRKKGKEVYVFLESSGETYKMIPGSDLLCDEHPRKLGLDLFISLDCGDLKRLGEMAEAFLSVPNLNIDHHISNDFFGVHNYVIPNSSSTSEIIYEILDGFIDIDRDIAFSLYTGLVYDTGCFKHSQTTSRTLLIASELMKFDIPFTKIQERIFYEHSISEARLMGFILNRITSECGGRLIYSFITPEEILLAGGSTDELSGMVAYLKNTKNANAAAFFYEKRPGEIKASLRSDDFVDVSKIAVAFGGGGHKKASGATILGSLEDAIKSVVGAIKAELN